MNLRNYLSIALTVALAAASFTSCNFGDYPGFKKTKTGIYYKIHTKDNTDTLRVSQGDIVTLSLKYGMKDSTLFDSRTFPEEIKFPVAESSYEGDFYEALQLLNQGDSATFVLKAGPLFTKTFGQPALPDYVTEETDIYFEVMLLRVQTEAEIEAETQQRNAMLEQEEMVKLQEYIAANNITQQPSESGIYYIETKKGSGRSPVNDEYASVHFTVFLLGSDQLFTTYDRGEPLEFKFGSQFENRGFQEAVGMMKEGGKANAIVPSSLAFGANGAGGIVPPFSTLYYQIELVDVLTTAEFDKKQADIEAKKQAEQLKSEQQEEAKIQKFLKDNNIKPTTVLPGGLVYIEKEAGTGIQPVTGKKVKVHYTGKLLDGTVFDSSIERGTPIDIPIGQRAVIEGWDKGIPLMKEGGKATLIIPSKMGYGAQGAGNVIPPNATLIFDVELVEVEK